MEKQSAARKRVIVISDDDDSELLDPEKDDSPIIIEDSEDELLFNIDSDCSLTPSLPCTSKETDKSTAKATAFTENDRKRKRADCKTTTDNRHHKKAKYGKEEIANSGSHWTRDCSSPSREKNVTAPGTSLPKGSPACASKDSCSNEPGTSTGEILPKRLVIWNESNASIDSPITKNQSPGPDVNLSGSNGAEAEDIFTCPICNCMAFSGKKLVQQFHRHFTSVHVLKYFECRKCRMEFQNAHKIGQHFIKSDHPVKCLFCNSDEVEYPAGRFIHHFREVHLKEHEDSNNPKAVPKFCPLPNCFLRLLLPSNRYMLHYLHRHVIIADMKFACVKCQKRGFDLCHAVAHYIREHGAVPIGRTMLILRNVLGEAWPIGNVKRKRKHELKQVQKLKQQKDEPVILATNVRETAGKGTVSNIQQGCSSNKGDKCVSENKKAFQGCTDRTSDDSLNRRNILVKTDASTQDLHLSCGSILQHDQAGMQPLTKEKKSLPLQTAKQLHNRKVIFCADVKETESKGMVSNIQQGCSSNKGDECIKENKKAFQRCTDKTSNNSLNRMDILVKTDASAQDPHLSCGSVLQHDQAHAQPLTKETKSLPSQTAKLQSNRKVIYCADVKEKESKGTVSNKIQPCNSSKGGKIIGINNEVFQESSGRILSDSSRGMKTNPNAQGLNISCGSILADNQAQSWSEEKTSPLVTVKQPTNRKVVWNTDINETASRDVASNIEQPCKSTKRKEPMLKNKQDFPETSDGISVRLSSEVKPKVKTSGTTQDPILPCGNMKNLSKFSHIIFIDLDNWGRFFDLPYSLPTNIFIWGFCGGNYASKVHQLSQYQKLVEERRFFMHPKCGTSKNAADFALCVQAARLDLQLPTHIPFTVLSGDRGFKELQNQLSSSERQIHLVDPHMKELEILTAILKSIGDV